VHPVCNFVTLVVYNLGKKTFFFYFNGEERRFSSIEQCFMSNSSEFDRFLITERNTYMFFTVSGLS